MGTYAPATPSTWSKGQVATRAFGMIGLAAYVFDLTAEQKAEALQLFSMMMAEWLDSLGCDLSYAAPATVDGDAWGEASGIPDACVNAVAANLALALCPGYGKTPSAETKRIAVAGLISIQAKCAVLRERELTSTTPTGAGNRWFGRTQNFFPPASAEGSED